MTSPMAPQPISDRYELVERIGSGGGGAVWRARDLELDRTVAIKLVPIPGDLSDDERERARARVSREARAGARVRHPAAVMVYDTVIDEHAIAIVMAYVDAPNLRQLVSDGGPLNDERTIGLARQINDVLTAAHDAGVIHRDVKPSNVLVADGDRVNLTDFGIASVGDETRLTRTGEAVGSPSYLAPEQARGEDPSPAADLWGLGATLYFAVTGVSPFDRGGAMASMHAALNEEPPPPERETVLWPLIQWLLRKQPDQRPSTVQVREYLHDPQAGVADAEAALDRTATQVLPAAAADEHAQTTIALGAGAAAGTGQDEATRGFVDRLWDNRVVAAAALVALTVLLALALWSGLRSPDGATDEPTPTPTPSVTSDEPTEAPPEEEPGGGGNGRSDGRGPDGRGPPGQR